jgi:SnoaL-like domain
MTDAAVEELRAELDELRRAVTRLNDIHSVRTLHFKYGYYIDMCLYDEAVDLFADDCVFYLLNGIWRGRESIRRCYAGWFREMFTQGVNGPIYGFLLDHVMSQDIVDTADDGLTARGRFRCLMQAGSHETKQPKVPPFDGQMWEGGISENVYIKEDGIWKIKENNYNMLWQTDFTTGWAHGVTRVEPLVRTYPEDPFGPDELGPVHKMWPHTRVVPFHYPHPVTGASWSGTKG